MPTKLQIDLNCDLGEGEPLAVTEALMRHVSSCSVACGGHYGDEISMRATVELARKYGVAVGAHPSFADRANFGRKPMPIDEAGLRALLDKQVGAMKTALVALELPVHHIKLHGALYNLVERDEQLAQAYTEWAREHLPVTPLIVLAGGCVAKAARDCGVRVVREFFADRAYRDDGTLVSRDSAEAMLKDVSEICARAVEMVKTQSVKTVSGKTISIQAETICVHGDTPKSAEIAARLRNALESAGIVVRAF